LNFEPPELIIMGLRLVDGHLKAEPHVDIYRINSPISNTKLTTYQGTSAHERQ
jgi:hypothetical protein